METINEVIEIKAEQTTSQFPLQGTEGVEVTGSVAVLEALIAVEPVTCTLP